MEGPWTILELAELAADALAATQPDVSSADATAGSGAGVKAGAEAGSEPTLAVPLRANGRVRDVPNERLVRWYVTVGLVDPPLSRRGRVAQYGPRHLLQLVAVKRRQAEGRSLAEIQAELAGATDEALAAVARLPLALSAPEAPGPTPVRFWARSAAQRNTGVAEEPGERDLAAEEGGKRGLVAAAGGAAAAAAHGDPADRGLADRGLADRGRADRGGSRVVYGVRLAPGVTLLLEDAGREPDPDDTTAILNAARALLAELASRRLREPGPDRRAGDPEPPPEVGQFPEGGQT